MCSVLCTTLSTLLCDDPYPSLMLLHLTHCIWTFPQGRSPGQQRKTLNYNNYNHSHWALIRSMKAARFVFILKWGNVILLHMKGQSKGKGKICSCLTVLEAPFPLNFNLLMVPPLGFKGLKPVAPYWISLKVSWKFNASMQSKPTPAMDMKIKQDRFYSALWDSPLSKTNGKLLL